MSVNMTRRAECAALSSKSNTATEKTQFCNNKKMYGKEDRKTRNAQQPCVRLSCYDIIQTRDSEDSFG